MAKAKAKHDLQGVTFLEGDAEDLFAPRLDGSHVADADPGADVGHADTRGDDGEWWAEEDAEAASELRGPLRFTRDVGQESAGSPTTIRPRHEQSRRARPHRLAPY